MSAGCEWDAILRIHVAHGPLPHAFIIFHSPVDASSNNSAEQQMELQETA